MNTQLLNLLLLLVFAHFFSCFLLLVPVSAKVFLSIDCGSSSLKPRTDNNSIVWVGDGSYIQTGQIHKVNVPSDEPSFDSNVMSTLRAFPTRKKNCYSIDIDNKAENNTTVERVLVRASFYYGNYDNKSSPPTFNLQFNGNNWIQVVTGNFVTLNEVVFSVNKTSNINVCLAQTQPGNTPFISALEVRSLDPGAYSYVPSDYPLIFIERAAFGTNKVVRYPDDSFDRIWSWTGPLGNSSTVTRVRSNSQSIKVDAQDKPPEAVLRTALMRSNASEDVFLLPTTNLTVPMHFNVYFSEVIRLNSTQKRSFDIVVNFNLDKSTVIEPKGPVIPPYGRALEVHIFNVSAFDTRFAIQFIRTNDSTLPSLINALEWYITGDKLAQGTNSNDVEALGLLQKSFIQLQNWNGDPCLPSPYTWDWVGCSPDADSPRITALYLNDLGLAGTLPDISAMTALKTIDLHNNSLLQEIPEYFGTLPKLTELNLADNNFFGTIPSSLSNNPNLKLNTSGNPNLSANIPSLPGTKSKTPSPDKGKSSKTLAQPIIILLMMLSGLL